MFSTSPRVERLQELIEADGFNQAAHFLLGEEYLRERRYMNAAAKFRRVVELNPDHAEAWLNMGKAYDQVGVPKEAERAYLSAARAFDRRGEKGTAEQCETLARAASAGIAS